MSKEIGMSKPPWYELNTVRLVRKELVEGHISSIRKVIIDIPKQHSSLT